MTSNELETLIIESLRGLSQDQREQSQTIQSLEARQTESEKQLTRLSELYRHLTPLIENISKALNGNR